MPCRVLRSTLYTAPDDPAPATLVVRECDLADPSVERAAALMERDGAAWGFVVNDIFEVGEADYSNPVRTTFLGMARLGGERARDERQMAISYFWNRDQLRMVVEGGALVNPRPAPLTTDQLRVVQRQLALRPEYRRQILSFAGKDGILTYRDGEFQVL